MLVYIRDEDESSKTTNLKQSDELRERYKNLLQDGVRLTFKELI